MTYDPEVPAGLQDADLEMAEMTLYAARIGAARYAGRCPHQGAAGAGNPTHGAGLTGDQLRCTDGCRRVFADDDAWQAAIEEALG
jgi:hypothetical protein